MFRKCPLLEVVDVRGVRTVTNRTIFVLAEYCRKLKTLLVKSCPNVTMDTLAMLCEKLDNVRIDVPILNTKTQRSSARVLGQI